LVKLEEGDIKHLRVLLLPDGVKVYFSYETPIAFTCRARLVVRVNDWKVMTGKHLNSIDGGSCEAKEKRVSGEAFEKSLELLLRWGMYGE